VITGTTATDITPNRETNSGVTFTLSSTDGSPLLEVEDTDHGLAVNDWVVFTSASAGIANFTTSILTVACGFQVFEVISSSKYKIYITDIDGNAINANATPTPVSSTITYYYKIASGLASQVAGNGFGAGLWGGDTMPTEKAITELKPDTSPSDDLIVKPQAPIVDATQKIYITGVTSDVGGLSPSRINNIWFDIDSTSAGGTKVSISGSFLNATAVLSGVGSFYYASSAGVVFGSTRGWGNPSVTAEVTGSLRRVYLDNYGEDIMFANSGGPIYYYDLSANTDSLGIPFTTPDKVGKPLSEFTGNSETPSIVNSFVISKRDGHCVALGCNDIGETSINEMLVRWSDQNNPFDWKPTATNTSGGQMVRVGSRIISGVSTKDEVIIFTDGAVYSMRFIGPPDVFSFNLITQGVSILGSRAAANASNAVFFMGNDGFYVYTGAVEPLACSVSSYVFDDFNFSQSEKVFTGVNSGYSEVMWFYPSADSDECNRYVVFNYEERVWYYGTFDMSAVLENPSNSTSTYNRTAWRDAIVFQNPMSTFISKYSSSTASQPLLEKSGVMVQETGSTGYKGNYDSYIETGDIEIGDGDRFSFMSRIIPDLQIFKADPGFFGSSFNVTISGRDFPGVSVSGSSPEGISKFGSTSFPVGSRGLNANFNSYFPVRVRARSLSMKFSSSFAAQWRLGSTRLDIRPDGRR
jgi:hypothetical protein